MVTKGQKNKTVPFHQRGRRHNQGSFKRTVALGGGRELQYYEALWKLWGGQGVSSDTVMKRW